MSAADFVVTGANGFLGREILCQLAAAGFRVRGTDLQPRCGISYIPYQQADIADPDRLAVVFRGASVIVHAAGLAHVFNPDKDLKKNCFEVNEIGTANVTSAAVKAGAQHIVLISSVSVYRPVAQGSIDEDSSCDPQEFYAESKRNAESRALEIARQAGTSLTVLRMATIYGEGDPGNIGRLLRALDKRIFFWIGVGRNKKSLLYKSDAARACLAVAIRPAAGVRIYNVSGPPSTMNDIVGGLLEALGKRPLIVRIPEGVALIVGRILSKLPVRRLSQLRSTLDKWLAEDVYDTGSFERDHGFRAQVGLNYGLSREVRWYLENKRNLN